jgi:uncharacterized membrane protein YcaP (DUF421 family)
MPDFVRILIFASVSFIYLFIIAKLLGKKQIAQLDFIDYVVGISIGSISAEMATSLDTPFYYYLISMTVFFLLDLTVTLLGRKTLFLKKLLKGNPLILISDGKIDYQKLKTSKLDINDVTGMCRDKGYFDLSDIAYAILETNGSLSILPVANHKPVVAEDVGVNPPASKLNNFLVVDSKVLVDSLAKINKTKEWLFDGLNIKDEMELKKIFLAYFDEKQQNFIVHYKNKD